MKKEGDVQKLLEQELLEKMQDVSDDNGEDDNSEAPVLPKNKLSEVSKNPFKKPAPEVS